MKIAISKGSGSVKLQNYLNWLKAADPNVDSVDLSQFTPNEAVQQLNSCAGLVLTGGNDVDPARYGEPEKLPLCEDIDAERDELEFTVAKAAVEMRMPVLGICRGLQVLNAAFGGTLVADLPSQRLSEVHHGQTDGNDAMHTVEVEPGSIIKRIAGTMEGEVNSAHHQAVERIAQLFTPSAYAADGTIEAFEWGDAALGGKPFLLAVQWHPERLDYASPFSLSIAKHFLQEAAAYELLFQKATSN